MLMRRHPEGEGLGQLAGGCSLPFSLPPCQSHLQHDDVSTSAGNSRETCYNMVHAAALLPALQQVPLAVNLSSETIRRHMRTAANRARTATELQF